ncbi:MAG: hypothetical protein EU539_06170 [Promethearchaeota archaeon]|nr:MAG: hypothetical protein EU539_06170 [Candidatus Lokiarchaeota archaeon]
MSNDEQAPCFIVIGIIILVMTFVIYFNFFFIIIGAGFILAGCCLSSQQQKRAAATSTTTPNTTQPVQSAPVTQPAPASPPLSEVKKEEKHKYCPYCGSHTTDNVCDNCGAKID